MTPRIPHHVTVTDVALRDGLQDEQAHVSTEQKCVLASALMKAGVMSLEVGAFVRSDRVPQMRDTDRLFAELKRPAGVVLSALVFNRAGAVRAARAGVDEVRLVVSASEGHSRANGGRPVAEALQALESAVDALVAEGSPSRLVGNIATAFHCPYDGPTARPSLLGPARVLAAMGARRLQLADTTGTATPTDIRQGIEWVREELPEVEIGLHLHNTAGMGLACVWEALQLGVAHFDAALGGLGGCPFAPGALGNVATEDLVGMLRDLGIHTGINLDRLVESLPLLEAAIGHETVSHRGMMTCS